MKLHIAPGAPIRVVTDWGVTALLEPGEVEVSDMLGRLAIHEGAPRVTEVSAEPPPLKVVEDPPPPPAKLPEAILVSVMRDLVRNKASLPPSHFRLAGDPTVPALKDAGAGDFTEEEREEAWAIVEAELAGE